MGMDPNTLPAHEYLSQFGSLNYIYPLLRQCSNHIYTIYIKSVSGLVVGDSLEGVSLGNRRVIP